MEHTKEHELAGADTSAENREPEARDPEKGGGFRLAPLTAPRAIIWNGLIIACSIIIGALIIAHGTLGFANANMNAGSGTDASAAAAGTDPSQAQAPAAAPNIKKVVVSDEPYIGSANAPVTLAYWSDYQCPFCKQFETQTLPTIITNYVSTGKVKVVFKDFAFLGADSTTAALYARAVWNLYPSEFFAWRTAMFDAQDAEDSGFGDAPSIQKLTATISGINVNAVVAAVAANTAIYQKEIDADRAEATQYGVEGTPSFITGTTLIPGVAPYSTFQNAFDAQLK